MSNIVRASLIICTRNRSRFLARTLASLLRQHERGFEVVIADDGSDDDTRDVAMAYQTELDIRYVRRAHVGIAAARNAAIRASRGGLLILCDDDRVADPGFVADHLAAHGDGAPRVAAGRQRGLFAAWARDAAYSTADVISLLARQPQLLARLCEPHAELVTPERVRDDLAGVIAGFAIDEPRWDAQVQPVLAGWGPTLAGFAFPWMLGMGGNVSVRRALADQVGLLDERFKGWGLEDTEFHYRLHKAGAQTVLLDGGLNYHQVHRRGAELAWEWARNARYMLDKHAALELHLYFAVCRRKLTLAEANQMVIANAALGPASAALARELVRAGKEDLNSLIAMAPAR